MLDDGADGRTVSRMIERMSDVSEGVIGFRFSGQVTKAEYTETVLPALQAAIKGDGRARTLVVIDEGFEKFEPGALWEDVKFGLGSGITHLSKWERTALVSDKDWARHAITLLGWMVPGDVKIFPLAQLEDAKAWVAA
jgi:hypothetical protein